MTPGRSLIHHHHQRKWHFINPWVAVWYLFISCGPLAWLRVHGGELHIYFHTKKKKNPPLTTKVLSHYQETIWGPVAFKC